VDDNATEPDGEGGQQRDDTAKRAVSCGHARNVPSSGINVVNRQL
jgi:hypothetical protein